MLRLLSVGGKLGLKSTHSGALTLRRHGLGDWEPDTSGSRFHRGRGFFRLTDEGYEAARALAKEPETGWITVEAAMKVCSEEYEAAMLRSRDQSRHRVTRMTDEEQALIAARIEDEIRHLPRTEKIS